MKAALAAQDVAPDWADHSVESIASSSRNAIVGGPFGSDLGALDYRDVGVPVIRGQNMARKFVSGAFVFVSDEKANSLESNLAHPGDIIFTQRGTVGQVSIVPDKPFKRYLISQSQMKLSVNPRKHNSTFLYYLFCSVPQQNSIQESTIQTGVPHINLGILRNYRLFIPALGEQNMIANALDDADAYIESLEQLLSKKRDIKQGAMQELLTGKRRLPGFDGDWLPKRLEEVADIRSGGTPSTHQALFWDGGLLWCTPTDITGLRGRKYLDRTTRTISDFGLKSSSAEIIPANSVVMTSRATIGECAINRVSVTTNQGFKNFVPRPEFDVQFLYYR